MSLTELAEKVNSKEDLSREESSAAMHHMLTGADYQEMHGFLLAMNGKKAVVDELVGFAQAIMSRGTRPDIKAETLLDTCGTGGDGKGTINASTAAAIVAASVGIPVAKHGNYAVSSRSGSADVLKALGYQISTDPFEAERSIGQTGFAFLLAPMYRPAVRRVSGVRKHIGRTIFNILGPLCNPADADARVVGVYDANLCRTVCYALKDLGVKRALVVHSQGLDEISAIGTTYAHQLRDGKVSAMIISPESIGFKRINVESLVGGDADTNAAYIREIFRGRQEGAMRDFVVMNAGAAIYVGKGLARLDDGMKEAEDALRSGAAAKKLERIVEYSRSF